MTLSSYNKVADSNSAGSGIDAAVRSHIMELGTNTLVQVKAVHAGNGITGTVDVQPMTHMQTTGGVTIPHDTIYGVPYLRVQGGACALIIDPVVGDIGYIVVSGRDQSNAVANRTPSAPASFRTHSMADCVYVGAYLGSDPTHYVKITNDGVSVITTGKVLVQAASAEFDCDVTVDGTLTATTDVKGGGISLKSHVHGGVQSGSSETSEPQ